jgi:hypothetical protein
VTRALPGPRSTPSMKLNAWNQVLLAPAGESPMAANCAATQSAAASASGVPARRPFRAGEARWLTSAWIRPAAAGASALCGRSVAGKARKIARRAECLRLVIAPFTRLGHQVSRAPARPSCPARA